MIIGNKKFNSEKTYIMGILNVTPDSFSDGGCYTDISKALKHTEQMINDGADIIDVGGESTRPGHIQITDDEEISRVVPIIKAIKANFDIPISVDTYKSHVAKAALSEGADLVNDIWGLKYDSQMADVVKSFDVPVCIMHNRTNSIYKDFLNDVLADLKESINIAKSANIDDDKIIIDPGVGFAKSLDENLLITKHLDILSQLGYPVLYASSRKSMIGLSLNLPVDQRLEGTLATTVIACMKGARFVRVHDVKENARVIKMTEAIIKSGC